MLDEHNEFGNLIIVFPYFFFILILDTVKKHSNINISFRVTLSLIKGRRL